MANWEDLQNNAEAEEKNKNFPRDYDQDTDNVEPSILYVDFCGLIGDTFIAEAIKRLSNLKLDAIKNIVICLESERTRILHLLLIKKSADNSDPVLSDLLITVLNKPFSYKSSKEKDTYVILWDNQNIVNSIFQNDDEIIHHFSTFFITILKELELISLKKEHQQDKFNEIKSSYRVFFNYNLIEYYVSNYNFSVISPNSLPMIICPNKWHFSKEKTLVKGGYLYPIKEKDRKLFYDSLLSQTSLDFINVVQKNIYIIDSKFLNLIENNFPNYLLRYMNVNNINSDCIIKNKSSSDMLNIISFRSFVEENLDNTISCIKDRDEARAKLKVSYRNQLTKIMEFFSIYAVSFLYQDYSLFFPCRFDPRGRLIVNSKSNFHFQSNQLVKALLVLHNLEIINYDVQNVKKYLELKFQSWEKRAQKKLSKSFFFLKFQEFDRTSISSKHLFDFPMSEFDVSASGFQILGGLIGDENLLTKTNFFTTNENEPQYDFYVDVYSNFVRNLKKSEVSICDFVIKSRVIFKAYPPEKINDLVIQIIDFLFNLKNRPFMKGVVMPFVYSEGDYSRGNKFNTLIQDEFPLPHQTTKKFLNLIMSALKRKISEALTDTIALMYPSLVELKDILKNQIPESLEMRKAKGLRLSLSSSLSKNDINNESSWFISFVKAKKVVKPFKNNLSNISTNICTFEESLNIEEFKYDLKKAKSSIMAHFVHFLEAEILKTWVLLLDKQKISVSSSHDCVSSNVFYLEQIQTAYFDAFMTVLFNKKNDPLKNFFLLNSSEEFLIKHKTMFDQFQKNKQKIIEKYSENKIIKKLFILT